MSGDLGAVARLHAAIRTATHAATAERAARPRSARYVNRRDSIIERVNRSETAAALQPPTDLIWLSVN